MNQGKRARILILGGGFGGLYAAMHFEKSLARHPNIDVTLVNRDNFFLFTPMLHEVAASDLDLTHMVNPVHKLLRHVHFFAGDVDAIDLPARRVVVSHGFDRHTHELEYDHLVMALGAITNFFNLPGLQERALTMKSLGDAIGLRDRLIAAGARVPGSPGLARRVGSRRLCPGTGPSDGCLLSPTAQHALREGKVVAQNITAAICGGQKKPFVFSTIGQLAAIGKRSGVANILGVNFSGFIAWWLWRTIYLSKLPRFEKKVRVALDWTLDLLFSKDLVQFLTVRAPTMSQAEEGEAHDMHLDRSHVG
ncbi:MAG TPA: FAD-dependent oxidoreductase [Candidatus Tectomicrobia bacterium]